MHHRYHIYMVYPQYGYGSLNDYLVRIVHHRYHIHMVYPLGPYVYVSSNNYLVRIVHHTYHIYMDMDMFLQTTSS